MDYLSDIVSIQIHERHGAKKGRFAHEPGSKADAITTAAKLRILFRGMRDGRQIAKLYPQVPIENPRVLENQFRRIKQTGAYSTAGYRIGGRVSRSHLTKNVGKPERVKTQIGDRKLIMPRYVAAAGVLGDEAVSNFARKQRHEWVKTGHSLLYTESVDEVKMEHGPEFASLMLEEQARAKAGGGVLINPNHAPNLDLFKFEIWKSLGLPWTVENHFKQGDRMYTAFNRRGDFLVFERGLSNPPTLVARRDAFRKRMEKLIQLGK
jgi:hypothetical protein